MPKATLDDLDRRILAELQADARLSQVTLAARVGLSRSAVQERMKQLEKCGVIAGYTLRLGDPTAEPKTCAYILLSDSGSNHDKLAAHLSGIPEVKTCESLSGEIDLILRVETESVADINRVRDAVAAIPGISKTQTLMVMTPRFDRR